MRYDSETGLYYLNSRYYDPETGRFLNADGELAGVGSSTLGYDVFLYCFNNPINLDDQAGNWPKWATGAFYAVSGALQMAAGAAFGAIGGKSNSTKHLMNLGKQSVKRPYNAVVHKGLKAAAKEGFSAAKYYCKNTVSYYNHYFKYDVVQDYVISNVNAFVTSDYMKSQYQRYVLG